MKALEPYLLYIKFAIAAVAAIALVGLGYHLGATSQEVKTANVQVACANTQTGVAQVGAKAAEHTAAVVVQQTKISQGADNAHQIRSTVLATAGRVRDGAATVTCSSKLPAVAANTGQSDAAATNPVVVESGPVATLPEDCRQTTLELVDLHSTLRNLGLAAQ